MAVKDAIETINTEMADLLNYFKEKHEEFVDKFTILEDIRTKESGNKYKKIDPNKLILVLANYVNLADWYLTEFETATTYLMKFEEAYNRWYGPCAAYAEKEMRTNKEHVTQATIKTKVALLWPDDFKEWELNLQKAKSDKTALEKRLAIIHDARYALNTLSLLRPIWDESTRGDRPASPAVVDAADERMKNS
jgi:hypothetical protein